MRSGTIRRTAGAVFVVTLLAGCLQIASAYKPGACRQDGQKLCPGMNDKEMIPCLKTHQDQLSEDCKVNLAEGRQMVRDVKDACQNDISKYCAGIQQGGGRIRRCLKAHEAELSPDCKASVEAFKQKYQPPTAPAASTVQVPAISSGTK